MNYHHLTNQSKIYFSYLIKYLEKNEYPTPQDKTKFKDIGYPSETTLYSFLNTKLHNHYLALEKENQLYKEQYPIGYQKIQEKIEKRKTYLNQSQKTEIFMKYIENNNIPSSHSTIYFYQIDPTTKNANNVGIWLQEQIANNPKKLLEECSKYKEQYKLAYEKIYLRLAKKLEINKHIIRLKTMMEYLEKEPNQLLHERIRFCDINPNCVDRIFISSWIQIQTSSRLINFKEELLLFKNVYPKAYEIINQKITNLEKNRQIKYLDPEERLKIAMDYLENNKEYLPKDIKFNDLIPNSNDNINIQSWLSREIKKHYNELITMLKPYQQTHKIAYKKILYRIEKQNNNTDLYYKKKIELFMIYANNFSINKLTKTKFSDIDPACSIDTNIIFWFHNQIYKQQELYKFIEEMKKYKDKYPIAYNKIKNHLNNSELRLNKERNNIINLLKTIKEELTTYENNTTIKETHILSKKYKINI